MHIAALDGSFTFLLGLPFSAGARGAARLHCKNSLRPKRRHQDGQPGGWNKLDPEKQITAATLSCSIFSSVLTDPRRLLFSSKVSAKEKSLSGKDSLFPSFLLSDESKKVLLCAENRGFCCRSYMSNTWRERLTHRHFVSACDLYKART